VQSVNYVNTVDSAPGLVYNVHMLD